MRGRFFWCAAGDLVLIALGLAVTNLIEDLFWRSRGLGWIGLALATIATVSLLAVGVFARLSASCGSTMEDLHRCAADTILNDDRTEGGVLVLDLITHTRGISRLARARTSLQGYLD